MSIGYIVYFTIYLFSTWNNLVFLFLIHYQNVDKVLVSFESGPKGVSKMDWDRYDRRLEAFYHYRLRQ